MVTSNLKKVPWVGKEATGPRSSLLIPSAPPPRILAEVEAALEPPERDREEPELPARVRAEYAAVSRGWGQL